MSRSLFAWIRLLRLPNVLTVPGDVLAGAALAGGLSGRAWSAIPAVCLAYLFGMALNDLHDVEADRRERSERPLPSGDIPLFHARAAVVALGLGAFALRPLPSTALLLAAIVAYTLLKDPAPMAGPTLMALCRGLAVAIGAGAETGAPPAVRIGVGLWMSYILMVTWMAEYETRERAPVLLPPLLPWLVFAGLLMLAVQARPPVYAGLPVAFLLWRLGILGAEIRRRNRVEPRHIGAYLGLLFVLQAAALAMTGHLWVAAALWLGWPLRRVLAAHVPAS